MIRFFYFRNSQNRNKISTRRHRTILIKTVSTKLLFFNELFIHRKYDNKRIKKDFIITKTSRVHKSIETRRCKAFDQSSKMQNIWMRLKKILLALTSKEVWLSSCESIKVLSRKELYSDQLAISINDSNTIRDFKLIKIWVQNL